MIEIPLPIEFIHAFLEGFFSGPWPFYETSLKDQLYMESNFYKPWVAFEPYRIGHQVGVWANHIDGCNAETSFADV